MTQLFELFVLGVCTGSLYTLSGLGIVAVYRASGVINFANGATSMIAGYLAYTLASHVGLPEALALILAVLASAVFGLVSYLFAVRPMAGASTLAMVFATLAIVVFTQQFVIFVYGSAPKIPRNFLPTRSLHFLSLAVSEDQVILLGASIVITSGLWFLFGRTRFGYAISALSESPRSLAALGWPIERLRVITWTLGGALAGIAGVALGPTLQLTPGAFADVLIPALTCALIGELRSFPLTFVGGILVGGLQAVASFYIHLQGVGDAVPFLMIIGVMIIRGKALPLRSFVNERLPRVGSGVINPLRIGIYAVLALILFTVVLNDNLVAGATLTLITGIILLSQIVITGYAGQLSLAQLTLAGAGAIVASKMSSTYHLPFLLALACGVVFIIPVSILLALPALRTRGFSLAIATLGFAVALDAVVLQNNSLSGGVSGLSITPQRVFGLSIDPIAHPRHYFVLVLVVFAILGLGVANIRRGRVGRRMLAVRGNERAAAALGINTAGVKLYAFTLAGMIAAFGGILTAFRTPVPQFDGYGAYASLGMVLSVVLFGIGYIEAAIAGGSIIIGGIASSVLLPWTNHLSWWNPIFPMVGALALILQLAYNPNGLLDTKEHGSGRNRRSQRAAAAGVVSAPPSRIAALRKAARKERRQLRIRESLRAEIASAGSVARNPRGSRFEARDISVSFGPVVAVEKLSFSVEPGEVLSVIGPNGAGKTTFMDAVTGFVTSRGVTLLDGNDISRWSACRRARAGLVRSFQSLELLDDMTVFDNLRCASDGHDLKSLFLDLFHPRRGALSPAMVAAIASCNLEDKLEKLPTALNYGDRRLVAIARAVSAEPTVLLLDEPAAGLSERERSEVTSLIRVLADEWNLAIVLIEHDVELVRRVSDRVIALDFGRVIAEGAPDDVLSSRAVVEAYLGAAPDAVPGNPDAVPGNTEHAAVVASSQVGRDA